MQKPWLCCLLALVLSVVSITPTHAATAYNTSFIRWHAADKAFSTWTLSGVSVTNDGALHIDAPTATSAADPFPAQGYNGHNFYNGGSFTVGEATSPAVGSDFNFTEAIASWNATTPAGTWIETLISASIGGRWTKWYNLGIWASDSSTVERHSVNLQGDTNGYVAVDTLVIASKKGASAFKLKLRLFSADGEATPVVHAASVAYSTTPTKPSIVSRGNPGAWGKVLSVPTCSQMVYPDGGEVWCSPTSTSMVVGYWKNDTGPCEPRVRAAVSGVYDWLYDGHGNWPFNTAYAATHGLEGYVARFTSMDDVEPWIQAGVPVIFSFGWKKSQLTGAPISSSNGHLAVIVGFDKNGNPVVNDPAAASNETVRRTYNRAELESLWLEHSGGTVYLVYPTGHAVPQL
jgi:hypothetical protein